MAGGFSSGFSSGFNVSAGGGTYQSYHLLLLGVGCVYWVSLILPTWYEK